MKKCNTFNQEPMGLRFGLESDDFEPKRKNRWIFRLRGVSALGIEGIVKALPPRKAGRPHLTWKTAEHQHLTETVYRPYKPDWKPIELHLYDINCKGNPVFDWVRRSATFQSDGFYNPQYGTSKPIVPSGLIRNAELIMLSGCGRVKERWYFEGCWPENIDWGDVDMDSSDVVVVNITLRYDRAYIMEDTGNISSSPGDPWKELPGDVDFPKIEDVIGDLPMLDGGDNRLPGFPEGGPPANGGPPPSFDLPIPIARGGGRIPF